MFTFSPDKLQTSKKIGSGRFGSVYPYQKDENDQRWVVKHIKANNASQLKLDLEGIVQGSNHDHPSILPIRGYYLQEQESGAWDAYIKLPRMKSNFKEYKEEYAKKKAVIPKDLMAKYFYSLASALDYLEKKNITHQDLKSTNVLLDQNMKVYLADTGMTKFASDEEKSKAAVELGGSELYMAPEIFLLGKPLKKKAQYKADVWSLGIVIAELGLSKPRPIDPSLSNDAKTKLVKEIIADLRKNYGQTMPDLVNSCLNVDPAQRPAFADIAKTIVNKYPDVAVKEKSSASEDVKQGTTAFGLFNTGAYLYKKAEDLLGTDKKKGVIERFEEKKEVKVAKVAGSFLAGKASGLFGSKKKEENEVKKEEQIAVSSEEGQSEWSQEFKIDFSEGVLIRPVNAARINDQKVEELFKDTLAATKVDTSNSLAVNLKGCKQITDKGLKHIGLNIKEQTPGLQQFTLELRDCYKVTDQGVKELITQISSNFDKLETLNLHFGRCNELSDQTLTTISSTITQSSKGLKSLTIDLRGNKKITDAGIKELVSQVSQKLEKLEQLKLDFNGCHQITDESLNQISSNLKNMKSLQQLSLEFGRCHKITDDGVKKLSHKIAENLKSLQELELLLYECDKVSNQTLDAARGELNYITYLII